MSLWGANVVEKAFLFINQFWIPDNERVYKIINLKYQEIINFVFYFAAPLAQLDRASAF